jgi:CHASE3 domain sensor protein
MTAKATRRTAAKFAVVLLNVAIVVICLNGVLFISTTRLDRNRAWVDHTRAVQVAIRQTLIALLDAESNQRAYLLTGDEKFYEGYGTARVAMSRALLELKRLTVDNPTQQVRVGQLRAILRAKVEFLREMIERRRRHGPDFDADDLDRGHRLLTRARDLIDAMDREEQGLYRARDERLSQTVHRLYAGLFAILGKDCIILAVLATASYRAYRLRRAYGRRAIREGPRGRSAGGRA